MYCGKPANNRLSYGAEDFHTLEMFVIPFIMKLMADVLFSVWWRDVLCNILLAAVHLPCDLLLFLYMALN
jgi:hypothetical protein